jgi:hypothetical protein
MGCSVQALVFDLDGTLLRSDSSFAAEDRAVLRKCHDLGIRIYVVTALDHGNPPLLGITPPLYASNVSSTPSRCSTCGQSTGIG